MSKNISIAVFVIAILAALFTLLLQGHKGEQSEAGSVTDRDINTMGTMTGCIAGIAILLRLGGHTCGQLREHLDNRRDSLIAQTELAKSKV